MRNILWRVLALMIAVFSLYSSAFSQGLNGYFDINKNITKQYDDGDMTLSTESVNRNLYLNVHEPITPVLTYQFNLRTNFLDSKTTDSLDVTSKRYVRSIEPALDLVLGNPTYSLSSGVRRREQWTAAHMNNDNRKTNDYYYSRLSLSPDLLPSLVLQFDRQKNYDYLSPRAVDNSNSVYSISSAYDLPPADVKFRYTVNYSYTVSHTPLNLNNKTISDNFNGTYSVGYSSRFWQNKADYSLGYQGNFTRNASEQFVTQTGTILNKRIPFGGLYIYDPPDPAVGALNSENTLINNDINTPTSINIGTGIGNINHNIGIWIPPDDSVDRLYVYVDKDISGDLNLGNSINWKAYKSDSNTAATTWTEITINQVVIFTDTLDNIYRYEIRFASPQNASYFKAVNLATVSAAGLTDVFVTEIEAYGTDAADQKKLIDASNSFTQQINFNTSLRPTDKLTLGLNYSLDRSDQNLISVANSVGGIFENIFSDSLSEARWNFLSVITRAYSASASLIAHRYLTTSFRVQRNETFDNKDETDFNSNSYNLSFLSEPLPTLNANLSLIRSDNYSFSEKSSTNDSALLSVGSRLYRDLNMITDVIYSKAYSYTNETTSTTQQINGTLDALLTSKLSGTFSYHISRTLSDGTPSDLRDGSLFITYRPGKLINITGNFKISDSDGDTSTVEGVLLDWLPLPAVRLNANYQRSDTEPGPVKTDTVNGYIIWYVTKFADVRFISSYSKQMDDNSTKYYSTTASLNCRF
ncbi:MAG: hypothetical protein AB1499_05875 [Nitrospirota bacterium]